MSLNGFNNVVTLTVNVSPSGLSCSVTPSSVSVNGVATATLVCTGSTVGSFTVIVTGTNGPLSHSTVVTVNVQDFAVNASPAFLSVYSGSQVTSTISVTGVNGFSNTVALTSNVSPSVGLTCSVNPTSVTLPPSPSTATLSCTGSAIANYTAVVTGTNGALSRSANITVRVMGFTVAVSPSSVQVKAGAVGTSTITVTSQNGFTGTIDLSVSTSPPGLSCSLSQGSLTLGSSATSSLSCSDSAGTYSVTVTATSGPLTHQSLLTFTVQDFTIASSGSVIVNAGSSATSKITVASVNAFTGNVTLTATVSPATGLVCSVTPSSVALSTSAVSSMSCSGAAGVYTVTLTGSSGVLSHSTAVAFTEMDLVLLSGTNGLTVSSGQAGETTIIVVSLDGFTGPVVLTTSVSPSSGLVCSLTPTTITLGIFGASSLSCRGSAPGTYNATVTAMGGGLSHSTSITFTVQGSSPTGIQSVNLAYFALAALLAGSSLGAVLVLKRFNATDAPFEEFFPLVGGEFQTPATILIIGDPGAGTTTLGLQIINHQLAAGKYCGLLTYDAFPSEIQKKMQGMGWEVTSHLKDGTMRIIDCYSALAGDEKAPIRDPLDFTEVSIQLTNLMEKAGKGPITIVLDSITSIFNSAQSRNAINFLRVLGAKVKNQQGVLILTGTKASIPDEVSSQLEAMVDGVIELSVKRMGEKTMKRILTVKKMEGHKVSSRPTEFEITSDKGILFKRQRISFLGR